MIKYFFSQIVLLIVFGAYLSAQTISGSVLSDENQPLPGVTVSIKGTNSGVVTDISGNFSIDIDSIHHILNFCFIGYNCKQVKVKHDTVLKIILERKPIQLNDIIIKGVYVRKKNYVSSSLVKKRGLFRKPDTIYGMPDTALKRLEDERKAEILKTVDLKKINDSINYIENCSDIEREFRMYITDTIKFPEKALADFINGKVCARFIVDEQNKISNIRILRSSDTSLSDEVISVLENMPPNIQTDLGRLYRMRNRQVPVEFGINILFLIIEK